MGKKIIKDEKVNSVIEKKENNTFYTISLVVIIILLLAIITILLFFNKKESKCCDTVEEETEAGYQLLNYQGFNFKMPLDWKYVNNENDYVISNNNESLFISLEAVNDSYDLFVSEDYQKQYLELVQTESNTIIEKTKKFDNYFLFDGRKNDYDYTVIAVGNNERTILVKAQFINRVSLLELKTTVINFATSYNK